MPPKAADREIEVEARRLARATREDSIATDIESRREEGEIEDGSGPADASGEDQWRLLCREAGEELTSEVSLSFKSDHNHVILPTPDTRRSSGVSLSQHHDVTTIERSMNLKCSIHSSLELEDIKVLFN